MQQRIIDPPKDQWGSFTEGKRLVFELFDTELLGEWEMYIQPHLNGLRPDIVLLNPTVGIGVFEIIESDQIIGNPLNKIVLYKDELLELYCPRLNDFGGKAARQAITAGIIFPWMSQTEVDHLFVSLRDRNPGMRKYPYYYPLTGSESVAAADLAKLFPESEREYSFIMSEGQDTAEDLRGWLKEPDYNEEQSGTLNIDMRDPQQREIVTNQRQVRYRRIKGPAGSGKSLALASRAAVLAREGKRVFICTFNITLRNYLRYLVSIHARYLASQHLSDPQIIMQNIMRQIDYLHFHAWCKRICILADRENEYYQLWRIHNQEDEALDYQRTYNQKNEVLDYLMAELVSRIYDDPLVSAVLPRYDAILVDEGQDYRLSWWQALRKAVTPGGEMLLVADKTQDIYETASVWTERPMPGAGFHGDWMKLKNNYRLPTKIIPILREFADRFPINEEADIPIPEQKELNLDPVILRWVQVSPGQPMGVRVNICVEEVECLLNDATIPNITFLSGNKIGVAFVKEFKSRGVNVLNTFAEDNADDYRKKDKESRRKKLAFFQGNAKVRATTLHSFKGWETRHLVIYVSRIKSPTDRALLYTALTRLKKHPNGSILTVVSSCSDLRSFGFKNFQPNFEEC